MRFAIPVDRHILCGLFGMHHSLEDDGPTLLEGIRRHRLAGCQEWVGSMDGMPSTLEDGDALGLAKSLSDDPTVDLDVEVKAVTKAGADVWPTIGSDDLVVGAMQIRQGFFFCSD